MYDPEIGRWNGVDRQAERYLSSSAYAYVVNNPLLLIDPNGEEIWIHYREEYQSKKGKTKYRNRKVRYEGGKLYDKKGNEYSGNNDFVARVVGRLDEISNSTDNGEMVVQALESHKGKFNIVGATGPINTRGLRFSRKGKGGTIEASFLRTNKPSTLSQTQHDAVQIGGLANELFHAFQVVNREKGNDVSSELQSDLFTNEVVEGIFGVNPIPQPNSVSYNKALADFTGKSEFDQKAYNNLLSSFIKSTKRGQLYSNYHGKSGAGRKNLSIMKLNFPLGFQDKSAGNLR